MKRIATFSIPTEVKQANEHLAKYPPEQVAVVDKMIVINYDDQTYPASYQAEELRALILSNQKGIMTTEISIAVGKLDLDHVRKNIKELSSEVVPGAKDKKKFYDQSKEINTKIDGFKAREKAILDAIVGLEGSIRNFENKNTVLQAAIDKLKL